MKFFADTADVEHIESLMALGVLDGVTTNPSIIAKSGRDMQEAIKEICEICEGPVSAEVVGTDFEEMIEEGTKLSKIATNVCIKLPMTWDGIKACGYFCERGIMTNVTLCFSSSQAIVAAKAGATFVSPFVGRLDDNSSDGMSLIADIRTIYDNYPEFTTQILVASVRGSMHVVEAGKCGADAITAPYKVIKDLINHPLTNIGLEKFAEDWRLSGRKI